MPKILTADQDLYSLECYKKLFSEAGIEVSVAEDASSALARFGECRPDLVILDNELPGGNGKSVLEKIRKNFMSEVPVLFAVKESGDMLDINNDSNVYLVKKDFKTNIILTTVKRILKIA